jgi:hypothetical protein
MQARASSSSAVVPAAWFAGLCLRHLARAGARTCVACAATPRTPLSALAIAASTAARALISRVRRPLSCHLAHEPPPSGKRACVACADARTLLSALALLPHSEQALAVWHSAQASGIAGHSLLCRRASTYLSRRRRANNTPLRGAPARAISHPLPEPRTDRCPARVTAARRTDQHHHPTARRRN